jgi:Gas vesicle protein G
MIGLVSGLRFVLEKVATVVDAELDDESLLRERLVQAQLDLEEGRIDESTFAATEQEVFGRLREIRKRRDSGAPEEGSPRVVSIEADVGPAVPQRRRR